jgi:hypothetical protein
MSRALIEFARRLQGQPWNQTGVDKTWALLALSQHQRFSKKIGSAERVAAR